MVYVLKGEAQFDEHRNTSRVFPVPAGSADEALRALARWKEAEPLHYAWVADGRKPIHSDAEHRERFGVAYDRPKSKR